MNLNKQLRQLYAYDFASCLRITSAVWVVLLVGRGFALWQVGLAEGIFHIVSLLCEIPSGMAADLLGRRRTLALSGVVGACSALAMALGSGFGSVCLSMGLSALSYNLISGTLEAITYDSLITAGRQDEYLQVDANTSQLQQLAGVISDLCSALAGVLSYVGFYLLDAAITLVRTALALSLTEPVVTETQARRQRSPFTGLPARLREHVTLAVGFLRANPRVAGLILANAVISLPSYLTLMFLQQRLADLGLPVMLLGLPLLTLQLAPMAGIAAGRRLKCSALGRLFAACAAVMGAGTLCAGAAPLLPAILGGAAAAAALRVWFLHCEKALNDAYPSDQRATLVSVDSMAYSLLMIAASPLTGAIGDWAGNAGAGLAALGAAVLALGLAAAVRAARGANA